MPGENYQSQLIGEKSPNNIDKIKDIDLRIL